MKYDGKLFHIFLPKKIAEIFPVQTLQSLLVFCLNEKFSCKIFQNFYYMFRLSFRVSFLEIFPNLLKEMNGHCNMFPVSMREITLGPKQKDFIIAFCAGNGEINEWILPFYFILWKTMFALGLSILVL